MRITIRNVTIIELLKPELQHYIEEFLDQTGKVVIESDENSDVTELTLVTTISRQGIDAETEMILNTEAVMAWIVQEITGKPYTSEDISVVMYDEPIIQIVADRDKPR